MTPRSRGPNCTTTKPPHSRVRSLGLALGPHVRPECRTDTSNWVKKENMYLQPVVRCKNPDCPTPSAVRIRLPYPNPPKSGENPPEWPQANWKIRLICRDC